MVVTAIKIRGQVWEYIFEKRASRICEWIACGEWDNTVMDNSNVFAQIRQKQLSNTKWQERKAVEKMLLNDHRS